ncbi:MAG: TetR/AcrR family transcriptional regulator [Bacilli bacterium]
MAKDDVKNLIMTKARELIKENGGFTIKELTDATHVNIAAVNYHFGSKENLTKTIIAELVSDLKRVLIYYIEKLEQGTPLDVFMSDLVNVIYDYTVTNAGLMKYLFLTLDSQQLSATELVSAFFSENEFTALVYSHLARLIGSNNPKEIMARYMIFFATGLTPMLVGLMQGKKGISATFSDEEFKRIYIAQMLKLFN